MPPLIPRVSGEITARGLTHLPVLQSCDCLYITVMAGSEAMTEKMICESLCVGLARLQLHGSQWTAV